MLIEQSSNKEEEDDNRPYLPAPTAEERRGVRDIGGFRAPRSCLCLGEQFGSRPGVTVEWKNHRPDHCRGPENGEPVLRRERKEIPLHKLRTVRRLIIDRLEPVTILDILIDTERWLGWTKVFGPLSGFDSKIKDQASRYVVNAFCYGCNLGPTQTARSIKKYDRKQIAWINQRHVTEAKLEEAITAVINAYNQFSLPKQWGSGKHVSADGTKWDLYEQNLLSEYHIRYGGYGGIGYYHVSDTYIALFSHFIPCGVWEAVYILDGLLTNQSDIRSDTVHADTQGQSTPVFGLSQSSRSRYQQDLLWFWPLQSPPGS